jgi:hypothetical protein
LTKDNKLSQLSRPGFLRAGGAGVAATLNTPNPARAYVMPPLIAEPAYDLGHEVVMAAHAEGLERRAIGEHMAEYISYVIGELQREPALAKRHATLISAAQRRPYFIH